MKLAAILFPAGDFELDEPRIEIQLSRPFLPKQTEKEIPEDIFSGIDLAGSLTEFSGRIEKLAHELEQAKKGGGAKEDEFGRFAKQAVNFVDGLDRILQLSRTREQSEETKAWLASVQAVNDRILRVMANFDFEVLDDTGREVDLSRHDVVEYRKTNDYPHNTVIEVMQKGIMFRGRMLRDARVIVACNE